MQLVGPEEVLVKDVEQTRNLVTHFLLMTFLASLNMSCHASFVLNGHCLPSAIHGDGLKYWLLLVKCYASLRHWLTQPFVQVHIACINTIQ